MQEEKVQAESSIGEITKSSDEESKTPVSMVNKVISFAEEGYTSSLKTAPKRINDLFFGILVECKMKILPIVKNTKDFKTITEEQNCYINCFLLSILLVCISLSLLH